ncbi:hypothetical protein ACFX14_036276 [Malus domestica]
MGQSHVGSKDPGVSKSGILEPQVARAAAAAAADFVTLKAYNDIMAIAQPMRRKGQGALGARCDFIGSSTNLIMLTTTSLMLFAGRFGLAPSANRKATAGLKLETRDSGLQTGDPAGFTLADTLACGTVGHIIGVGFVLGLKNVGAL